MVLTIDRIRELTEKRGAPGNEKEVRDYIIEQAKKFADDVRIDKMGSVIATKKGTSSGRTVLLTAHMDEVAFLVQGAEENGLVRYICLGSIDPRVVVSKHVVIGKDKVPGVIGAKAIHLQSASERGRVFGHGELRIDIGAKSREAAEALVSPGDYITFDTPFYGFGDGYVRSRALDDRVGCLTLLRVLEAGPYPVDVVCAFTTMEELGCKGAKAVGFDIRSDVALNFEGTAANDLGCVPEQFKVCRTGEGVAISFADNSSLAHRGLFKALMNVGKEAGVAWQIKQGVTGSNDAGSIQTAAGARPTCVLSVPCRYIHSGACVCKLSDIDAQFELTDAYLRAGAPL